MRLCAAYVALRPLGHTNYSDGSRARTDDEARPQTRLRTPARRAGRHSVHGQHRAPTPPTPRSASPTALQRSSRCDVSYVSRPPHPVHIPTGRDAPPRRSPPPPQRRSSLGLCWGDRGPTCISAASSPTMISRAPTKRPTCTATRAPPSCKHRHTWRRWPPASRSCWPMPTRCRCSSPTAGTDTSSLPGRWSTWRRGLSSCWATLSAPGSWDATVARPCKRTTSKPRREPSRRVSLQAVVVARCQGVGGATGDRRQRRTARAQVPLEDPQPGASQREAADEQQRQRGGVREAARAVLKRGSPPPRRSQSRARARRRARTSRSSPARRRRQPTATPGRSPRSPATDTRSSPGA